MLLDLQRVFRKTVTSHDDLAAPHVSVQNGAITRRLAVYRNTVQRSLVDVLAAAFPVVQRIVGAKFFFALARDFAVQHPPAVAQLSVYGADFASFVTAHPQTQAMPYLGDVARLEWARGESYFAADAAPLDPQTLAAFTPDALPNVKFQLHPAARLVRSLFPIHRIWSVNQPDVNDVPAVDMENPESVLITRPQYIVGIARVSEADAAFIEACAGGATLNDATLAALRVDEGFDLQTALQACFIAGVFSDVSAG